MKINDNILVGVPFPKLVSFYGTLIHYSLELELQYPNLADHELIGLVVTSDDSGSTVVETFYTIKADQVYKTTCTGYKEKPNVWSEHKLTDKVKMFEHIRKQTHILDLEYYLKNN